MAIEKQELRDLKVLVVDDSKNMLELIATILSAIGVRNVFETTDATTAFAEIAHFKPDIIITDWHMEPLNGLDFVRKVRRNKSSPDPYVPIIMLTGHTSMKLVVEARDAGINEFLVKPISPKSLLGRISAILDGARPFIRIESYSGPCRRRKDIGPPDGRAERREDARARAAG
jgi:two-component system, chemotaxis family, chemotaxis protein CheY